jgi:hypothetical protein
MTWPNMVNPVGQPVTRATWDLVFFFQMWDLKPINIYTLCSQEKKVMFFQYGIKKKSFGLNTST